VNQLADTTFVHISSIQVYLFQTVKDLDMCFKQFQYLSGWDSSNIGIVRVYTQIFCLLTLGSCRFIYSALCYPCLVRPDSHSQSNNLLSNLLKSCEKYKFEIHIYYRRKFPDSYSLHAFSQKIMFSLFFRLIGTPIQDVGHI
jgi:hypothetical protein